jgi:hypothetical protein
MHEHLYLSRAYMTAKMRISKGFRTSVDAYYPLRVLAGASSRCPCLAECSAHFVVRLCGSLGRLQHLTDAQHTETLRSKLQSVLAFVNRIEGGEGGEARGLASALDGLVSMKQARLNLDEANFSDITALLNNNYAGLSEALKAGDSKAADVNKSRYVSRMCSVGSHMFLQD